MKEKYVRADISSPKLIDPIRHQNGIVKVLLEMPKNASSGSIVGSISKGRDLIQYDMNTKLGLAAINQDIMEKYHVNMEKHELLIVLGRSESKFKRYLTDDDLRNNLIANGSTISIGTSVKRLVTYIIKKISERTDMSEHLNWVRTYAEDTVFNREFCKNNGDKYLVEYLVETESDEERAPILSVLLALIDDHITYESLIKRWPTNQFTTFIIECLNRSIVIKKEHSKIILTFQEEKIHQQQNERDLTVKEIVIQKCLAILERGLTENCNIVSETKDFLFSNDKIQSRLTLESPLAIHIAALNFVNQVLFRVTERGETVDVQSMNKLRQHVLSVARQDTEDIDLRSSIAFFQNLLLANNYRDSFNTKGSSVHAEMISKVQKNLDLSSWEKLSLNFKDDPLAEFCDAPPGILPLKCLVFFTRKYYDRAKNLIINNSENTKNAFLVVSAAKVISIIIADELQVVDTSAMTVQGSSVNFSMTSLGNQSNGSGYLELVLAQDNVLEELFCTIMLSFFSTWQEMKAISTDFKKVTQIVREQVHEALWAGGRLESLDKFRRNLTKCGYQTILEKREKRQREGMVEEYNNPQVMQLSTHIRSEVEQHVVEQRTNFIRKTACFHENPTKPATRFFARFNRNLKLIMYSEEESNLEDFEKCKHIKINEIQDILIGKECPHIKVKARKHNFASQAFTIKTKTSHVGINFVASITTDQIMWTDGIKCLMKEFDNPKWSEMKMSNLFHEDIDVLTKLRMRVKILQFKEAPDQTIEIPETFPKVNELEVPPLSWITY